MPVMKPQDLVDERFDAIRAYHKAAGIPAAQLDLSGGVDSGVMAGLLVLAHGEQQVAFVHSRIHTNPASSERAHALALALRVPLYDIDLTAAFEGLVVQIRGVAKRHGNLNGVDDRIARDATVLGSVRSTLRAPVGRAFGRFLFDKSIRHGTGNECEDRFLRYYQKGGDGEVDTNPLAMLSKTETYQLAFALGNRFGGQAEAAYRDLIVATPSADLWGVGDDQADETELKTSTGVPFTYGRINADTGAPSYYGTIECVARFLDLDHEDVLFGSEEPDAVAWAYLARAASRTTFRNPLRGVDEVKAILQAARRVEASTRHKKNPNIPMLGNRANLVAAGLLTNELT